jgi:hypothetical protein
MSAPIIQFADRARVTGPLPDPTEAYNAFVAAQLAYEENPSSETRARRQRACLAFHAAFVTGAA